MWQPSHFATRPVTLDFSSSSGGSCHATRLYADEERIANAIELTNWADDRVQIDVCEHCGHTHCQAGGWVSFRRLGEHVLVLPAFAAMLDNEREYSAPDFLRSPGLVFLGEPMFSNLRSFANDLPLMNALAPLTKHEAVLAYQWESPGHVLGQFPSPPAIDPALVLASDLGEPGELVQRLNVFLAEMFASHVSAQPVEQHMPISLYLDLPGYPAWPAFSGGDRPALVLGQGLAVGAA